MQADGSSAAEDETTAPSYYELGYGRHQIEVNDRYWKLVTLPSTGLCEITPSSPVHLQCCHGEEFEILPHQRSIQDKAGQATQTDTFRLLHGELLPAEQISKHKSGNRNRDDRHNSHAERLGDRIG
jgi:hypothetical protein